jgi:hypothetical protein
LTDGPRRSLLGSVATLVCAAKIGHDREELLQFVNPTNNDGTRNAVLLAGSRVNDPHESEARVVVSCRGRAKSVGRD